MEKTQKFQLVHMGPTNLGQHFTTDLARGIMQGCDCKIALGAENFKKSISCATGACCCRGVWGHPPHNFFCFLDAKWCILRPF